MIEFDTEDFLEMMVDNSNNSSASLVGRIWLGYNGYGSGKDFYFENEQHDIRYDLGLGIDY